MKLYETSFDSKHRYSIPAFSPFFLFPPAKMGRKIKFTSHYSFLNATTLLRNRTFPQRNGIFPANVANFNKSRHLLTSQLTETNWNVAILSMITWKTCFHFQRVLLAKLSFLQSFSSILSLIGSLNVGHCVMVCWNLQCRIFDSDLVCLLRFNCVISTWIQKVN